MLDSTMSACYWYWLNVLQAAMAVPLCLEVAAGSLHMTQEAVGLAVLA